MARPYRSSLRAEQALLTRRRIIDAAKQHFVERGWAATTMKSIADEAEVAPATVYAVFGTKRALLSALMDEALTGVADPNLDWWREAIEHDPDQAERARQLVALLARMIPRVAPYERLVREAARADEEIAGLACDLLRWRRAASAVVVKTLAGEEGLSVSLDDAADYLFAFAGPEVYSLLVDNRGWSVKKFEGHLTALVQRLLPINSEREATERDAVRSRRRSSPVRR